MNEITAQKLEPVRAAELARVLELQSRWENMRADGGDSTVQLQSLQRAFEAYRVRLAEYTARHRSDATPDLSPSGPDRLVAWCRAVRAVFQRAGNDGECPAQVVTKARRMADRIAARLKEEPVAREPEATNMTDAIRQLDTLITWCDKLMMPAATRQPERGQAFEVGGQTT